MDDSPTLHASKRKQECMNNGSVHHNRDMESLDSKKQRLAKDVFYQNGNEEQHSEMVNGDNGCGEVTGQLVVTNDHKKFETNVSEPMECTEEINNGNFVEVNGNETKSNSKLCPHGHLNSCTTYNVPCRYPRMYCHPGGIIEDRLQAYHGF